MVGSGRATVAAVADLSRAYVRDMGEMAPKAVCGMASLGGWGSHPQNQERDLHRWVGKIHGLTVETFEVKIPCQATVSIPGYGMLTT